MSLVALDELIVFDVRKGEPVDLAARFIQRTSQRRILFHQCIAVAPDPSVAVARRQDELAAGEMLIQLLVVEVPGEVLKCFKATCDTKDLIDVSEQLRIVALMTVSQQFKASFERCRSCLGPANAKNFQGRPQSLLFRTSVFSFWYRLRFATTPVSSTLTFWG